MNQPIDTGTPVDMSVVLPIAVAVFLFWLIKRRLRVRRVKSPLDRPLLTWPDGSPLTVGHLLRSIEVKGITGSGKSSGSGARLMQAIVSCSRSTMLIIAQKPEERDEVARLFKKYRKPLIVIEEGGKERMNFLEVERAAGADTRQMTELLMTLGEVLDGGNGRSSDPFWKKLEERILYNALEALRLGTGRVTAADLLEFITSAPYSSAQIKDDEWRKGFHFRVMDAAFKKTKTTIEERDFRLASAFWSSEFPQMDDKPRSSGLAGVFNTVHTFNTGLVSEICSTKTTVSPQVFEKGASILVNFPFAQYGPSGRFIAGGIKYLAQKHILRRKWNPKGYFNVLHCDEFQECVTEFDSRYLAQCRSHGGSMLTLTQTVHSEYSGMGGGGASRHKVDALSSNYGTHVYHLCDPATAEKASGLLGQRLEAVVNMSTGDSDAYDLLFGSRPYKPNVQRSYQPILQPGVLMGALRTGGARSGGIVDGLVIRPGEPFRSGENFQWVAFKQPRR